jgi:hypothetical protein
MKKRRLDINPDLCFQEDIEKLLELSFADAFADEHHALYIRRDCIQISLKLSECFGSPVSIGNQFLIIFESCSAVGEVYRIDDDSDDKDLSRIVYLQLIKRETSYPEWEGSLQILKVKIELIHYNTAVYKRILSSLRNQQLKKALEESRKHIYNSFPAFKKLINGLKASNISVIYEEEDSMEILKEALKNAYKERQTFIVCSPSTDRLLELAEFCNDDTEMSKQTIVFPPGMFINDKWKSESLNKITVHQIDYNMDNSWDIARIEHDLKFRGQDAAELMARIHPRIILGTPASLILIMDGLNSHYCQYKDRLPKGFIFDQAEKIPDVFALILLSTFPSIKELKIFHQREEEPMQFGINTGSLATMAKANLLH